MENLHLELKLDIFSRLPVESVLECKLVCKTWLRLLKNDPLFPQMHLRRSRLLMLQQLHDDDDDGLHNNEENLSHQSQSQTSSGFEFGFIYFKQYLQGKERSFQLWYGKYGKNEGDETSFRTAKRINHRNFKNWWNAFVASCNGLICFNIPHHRIEDPIYICNPITREFVNLPRFIITDEIYSSNYRTMVGGFGYSPFTNEYKVVRIFYPNYNHDFPQGRVQVYTLGDGNGWRDKGEITYSILPGRRGILVNGELHWLVNKWKIVAFNLALEEFHLITSPPIMNSACNLSLMGRWLCLSNYVPMMGWGSRKDMWLLKKKTRSTNYDDMNEQVEYHRGGWIKEFTITTDYAIDPLGLTKRSEILLVKSRFLCIYDLKTATLEELEELDNSYCYNTAIPHMNSFVSLKHLGEKCRRRKRNFV